MKRRLAKLLTILLTVSAISGAEVVSAAAAVAAPGRVMAAETDMPDAAAVAETAEEPAEDPVPEEPVIGDTDVPADPMADLEQQEEKKEEQAGETAAEGMTEEAAAEAATAEEAAVPAEEITEAEEAAEAVKKDANELKSAISKALSPGKVEDEYQFMQPAFKERNKLAEENKSTLLKGIDYMANHVASDLKPKK